MFFPPTLIEKARANIQQYPWAAEMQRQLIEAAQPWMGFSDEELWSLMFGNTITRSWMVWSNGYCPACKTEVPMYGWEIDALQRPWTVRCPHCQDLFPKNDFHRFYRSGLDDQAVFDPARADRTLLFNVEHPDPADPLHLFGVDDGEGYVEGDHRWRFIGAYLIYGQWKQAVLGGITRLAAAYVVTGERAYAHKAGVLLDRVADLYPTFDFQREGLVYEGPGAAGYVSTWHDACEETRELALAYGQVRDGLRDDVRRNIEDRILHDAVTNRAKIRSNYPRTDIAIATIKTVLDWPGNRDEVNAILDAVLEKATAVDGVTGEKGLAGYSSYVIQGLAILIEQYARLEPQFLRDLLQRHPRLHQMFRFHIDTWCFQQYYPQAGDTGAFAMKAEQYVAVPFSTQPGLAPSMYTFLWQLYALTGDVAFVQALYHANGGTADGLPYDLFAGDSAAFQQAVREVIAREGTIPQVGSVNKQQWHLAILRSGQGTNARALWLDYDAGGGHGHADGMNLGLFAKGLDLMPDFGYPPVHYGGWSGPKFDWYLSTAGHNTVVVDGQNQPCPSEGVTTLWADGKRFRAVRVSGPALINGLQFERTVALIDISDRDSYIIDLFRVVGGTDHVKFMHSHFGRITTAGLSLTPAEEYGHGAQMRQFYEDPAPQPGWSVDWTIDDRYHYLSPGADVHLRHTDLTTGAHAFTAEAWVSVRGSTVVEESWIPRILVRRQATEGPLASTFVSVIEPYDRTSNIAHIRRLSLQTPDGVPYPDSCVAVEVQLTDGRRDLFVAADVENPLRLTPSRAEQPVMVQDEWNLRLDGEAGMVRRDAAGAVRDIALCRGKSMHIGDIAMTMGRDTEFAEVHVE